MPALPLADGKARGRAVPIPAQVAVRLRAGTVVRSLVALVVAAAALTAASPSAAVDAAGVRLAGVVLASPTRSSFYLADRVGRVALVLATRSFPAGTRVSVTGTAGADGWTVFANGLADRVVRVGTARRVAVRAQVGFVDSERRRFQLAAHGQIVADVRFAAALAQRLVRLSFERPLRTHVLTLAVAQSGLVLVALRG